MKPIHMVTLSGTLLALLAAAPAQESPEQKATRLQAEVESLRQTNASLEKRLMTIQAENLRLQAELARTKSQPRLAVPHFFGSLPGIPENAVPKGEGNVRHYIIPVELKLSEPGTPR